MIAGRRPLRVPDVDQSAAALRALLGTAAPTAPHDPLQAQLMRFGCRLQGPLSRLAASSKECADLLFSFPAAAVAIVTGRVKHRMRRRTLRLVASGAPLSEIARALALPMWMRRLPPEAFGKRLPHDMGGHDDVDFGRRLLNLVPGTGRRLDVWLDVVFQARAACDDEFALWIADQRLFAQQPFLPRALLPLALFSWFSRRPDLPAGGLIPSPWTPGMNIARAASETHLWLLRVLRDLCVENDSAWAQEHAVDGLAFVPLTTAAALREEGVAMRKCLARYTESVAYGTLRIYSIRHQGGRIADIEVRPMDATGRPSIFHLLGPANNKDVPQAVREAADAWLAFLSREPWPLRWRSLSDETFQRCVWHPYASALAEQGRTGEPGSVPPVSRLLRFTNNLYAVAEAERAQLESARKPGCGRW